MGKFILGMIAGLIASCVLFGVTDASNNERAVKAGWIKIGEEIYTLRKAVVVEVNSQS